MPYDKFAYYLGIRFVGSEKSYYFACEDNNFALGDLVIVMTAAGVEAGKVTSLPMPMATYNSNLELKPILRKADSRDIADYNQNVEDAKKALAITRTEVERLGLAMDLTDAYYNIDASRITITYTSTEKRVDFRELLKVLAAQLGCRIELRQIASRDKAKMIGGIGICGLPLCCTTFLNQFEGISIQRAKNQMLTLNIPKLSGHCGKLICCLTFEDDAYTEAKKEFPKIGMSVQTEDGQYAVDGINVLSRTVRLVNSTHSDYKTFTIDEFRAILDGTYKPKVELLRAEEALPSFGIEKTLQKEEKPSNSPAKNTKDDRNRDRHNQDRRDRHDNRDNRENRDGRDNKNRFDNRGKNNSQKQGGPKQNPQNQKPKQAGDGQQPRENKGNFHRHRHNHHRHGGGNKGGNGDNA